MADEVSPLLKLDDVAVHFPMGGGWFGGQQRMLRAVDGVTLDVKPGECLGLVGESGCGKSTLALSILGLVSPVRGSITLDGKPVVAAGRSDDRSALARTVQMVFQDPYASLNPRQTVRRTLSDPLRLHGITNPSEVADRVAEMMARVGLRPEHYGRYPHMFSGGQRQRVAIARALMLQSPVVVADEPVSALDVSIQAQVLNLLLELQDEMGVAYVFISHDLGVVRHLADEVLVMYLGRPVEHGPRDALFEHPCHPYTRALLAAMPRLDPAHRLERVPLAGELPSPLDPPSGCAFHTRCPLATGECRQLRPEPRPVSGRLVACHHAERIVAA